MNRYATEFYQPLSVGNESAPGIADYTSTGQRGSICANAAISVTPVDFLNVAVRGGAIHNEWTDGGTFRGKLHGR